MKSNVQRRKHTKRVNKHKTSVSAYCGLATVTYRTQMRNYTDIMALQCKDCGDRKVLKCQEQPKYDSVLFFHDRKKCMVANPDIAFSVFFGSSYCQQPLFFTTSNSLPSCWYSSVAGIFSSLFLYLRGRTLFVIPSCF